MKRKRIKVGDRIIHYNYCWHGYGQQGLVLWIDKNYWMKRLHAYAVLHKDGNLLMYRFREIKKVN